ncbi:MAG: beta-lactamase family protein, partial [Proteobacteria bacterium]|nr:beta-lactamase family protein [Pseudomonadota bacterium]
MGKIRIEGDVAPGFEPLRRAFEENFSQRNEVGAAICVYRDGKRVVSLWGGDADRSSGQQWQRDTLTVVFSTTKGLVATCFAILVDRGQLELDAPVAQYWPAFGNNGKESITVRQLLNHRAGLAAHETRLSIDDFLDDPQKVRQALENQRPGRAEQAYGATAWGAFVGELFHQATGTTVGQFLAQEVAKPLGAEVYIGLPRELEERVARLQVVGSNEFLEILPTVALRRNTDGRVFRRLLFGKKSLTRRAIAYPYMGPQRTARMNDPRLRRAELPWASGVASAEGLARVYAALANGGTLDGVQLMKASTIKPLYERQSWSNRDGVMQKPIGFAQGFQKEQLHLLSPNIETFGHYGAGGSFGFADPKANLSVAYLMNRMDWRIRSERGLAICQAVYAS